MTTACKVCRKRRKYLSLHTGQCDQCQFDAIRRKVCRDCGVTYGGRAYAYAHGLPIAPTQYAWGSPFVRASKAGIIKRVGYRDYGDATMHTQTVAVWRAA